MKNDEKFFRGKAKKNSNLLGITELICSIDFIIKDAVRRSRGEDEENNTIVRKKGPR